MNTKKKQKQIQAYCRKGNDVLAEIVLLGNRFHDYKWGDYFNRKITAKNDDLKTYPVNYYSWQQEGIPFKAMRLLHNDIISEQKIWTTPDNNGCPHHRNCIVDNDCENNKQLYHLYPDGLSIIHNGRFWKI